jgi:tRNA A37 N6-isopentenylltransferase MiaA
MQELLRTATWQYAKRQRTWFKRNKEIHWLNPANKNRCLAQAAALVKKILSS